MADEYQNAVKKLMEYLDQTAVFAKGELPDVANQMLVYGASMGQFWLIVWCAAAGLSVFLWVIYMIFADGDHAPGKIIVGLLTLGMICFAGSVYSELVMIEKAPKLYIMHEMGRQLKATQCNSK